MMSMPRHCLQVVGDLLSFANLCNRKPLAIARLLLVISALAFELVYADAYRPTDDATVLIRLSPFERIDDQPARALIAKSTVDLASGKSAIKALLESYRQSADARWLGYAEGVLNHWLHRHPSDIDLIFFRARISQSRHQYEASLTDLKAVLTRLPRFRDAWITKAIIEQTRGEYSSALNSCSIAVRLKPDLVAHTCVLITRSLTGHLQQGIDAMRQRINAYNGPQGSVYFWALAELAHMQRRAGEFDDANKTYRHILAKDPANIAAWRGISDLLLESGSKTPLDDTMNDLLALKHPSVLVNTVLLGKNHGLTLIESLKSDLLQEIQSFDDERNTPHLLDHARAWFFIFNDPESALAAAVSNWDIQRSPDDALMLLQVALDQSETEIAKSVVSRLDRFDTQDRRIENLLGKFGYTR